MNIISEIFMYLSLVYIGICAIAIIVLFSIVFEDGCGKIMENKWVKITDETPPEEELVLCVSKQGSYFLGKWRERTHDFYVPNYRGGFRKAIAWSRFDRWSNE